MSQNNFAECIGRVINQLRISLDMTQGQLSEKSGVSNVVISRIESGSTPELKTLAKLALALGRHPYEILWMAETIADNESKAESAA